MCNFADASCEVDPTDCAVDGDPRELLKSQRARIEVSNDLPHVAKFRLKIICVVSTVTKYNARQFEVLVTNGQVARVQLSASVTECQKLVRNANAAFRPSED